MACLAQTKTGNLTELRVKEKLEAFGLNVMKPVPDRGVDFVVSSHINPDKIARIQVKGRNPEIVSTRRWFQIRVTKKQMEIARDAGKSSEQAWHDKVEKVDFFILDAVRLDEMWVLPLEQVFELIRLNEPVYATRPDNVFVYDEPLESKQKEMNIDVPGAKEQLAECKNNFLPILKFLDI